MKKRGLQFNNIHINFDTIKKINYRHYICIAITIGLILLSAFCYPKAFFRLIETFVDLGLSIAYYFCELFGIEHSIVPSVAQLSKVMDTITIIPGDFENFKIVMSEYGRALINMENFKNYVNLLDGVFMGLMIAVLFLIPLVFVFLSLFKMYLKKDNNNYNEDSKSLVVVKKIGTKVYLPIKKWFSALINFFSTNSAYCYVWLAIIFYSFNIFAIVIDFIAYYFYFFVSLNIFQLYLQVYKLFCDLAPIVNTFPFWCWVVFAIILVDIIRKRLANVTLNRCEARDCKFINDLPIITMVCGTMGKKKTTMLTDMALSQEVMFRNKAFELLLENDLKFPNFPWLNLELELKAQMEKHNIYNLATVRRYIDNVESWFKIVCSDVCIQKAVRRNSKKTGIKYPDYCFGYDYKKYGLEYDDKLKIYKLFEVIRTYSQLYYIYIMESSLLVANYSIREDSLLLDLGNFPIWDSNFFNRDSKTKEAYSRHSHILDFDSLRLGRKVLENNAKSNAFEFGVIVITEVGKERGNAVELRGVKKTDDSTNQLNDLFNLWLKMARHSATVDNFPFIKVFVDEQRPESFGADARDLCFLEHIDIANDYRLALPFFFVEELIYNFVFSKFNKLYYEYRYLRGDNTTMMYVFKNIMAKLQRYYKRIYNRFMYIKVTLLSEAGTMDAPKVKQEYYLCCQKIYSDRFSTDCFSDFFAQKSLSSNIGINDLEEYASTRANFEELKNQHSYFITDLLKDFLKEGN